MKEFNKKCPDTKINIGTHSLGARVALTSLLLVNKINKLILTNPAVSNNSFDNDGEFYKAAKNAESIIIATSYDDSVLNLGYVLSEADMALGQTGPETIPTLKNIHTIDYTDSFKSDHSAVYDSSVNKKYWEDVVSSIQ